MSRLDAVAFAGPFVMVSWQNVFLVSTDGTQQVVPFLVARHHFASQGDLFVDEASGFAIIDPMTSIQPFLGNVRKAKRGGSFFAVVFCVFFLGMTHCAAVFESGEYHNEAKNIHYKMGSLSAEWQNVPQTGYDFSLKNQTNPGVTLVGSSQCNEKRSAATLEQIATEVFAGMQQKQDVLEETWGSLQGRPALRVAKSGHFQGHPVYIETVATLRDGCAYLFHMLQSRDPVRFPQNIDVSNQTKWQNDFLTFVKGFNTISSQNKKQ